MDENILANLRNVLASLYSDEVSIRRIVADAEISAVRIRFDTTTQNIWYFVLEEAIKTQRLDTLLSIVKKEYGTNQQFLKACASYCPQNKQQELHKDTVPYNSTKIIRECLEQSFDSESIRVFCQDYFDAVFRRLRSFDGLDQVITEIIKYSDQHNKFDYLWESIMVERPSRYKIYFPRWQNVARN